MPVAGSGSFTARVCVENSKVKILSSGATPGAIVLSVDEAIAALKENPSTPVRISGLHASMQALRDEVATWN